MRIRTPYLVSTVVAFTLACGGGGDTGTKPVTPTPPVPVVTVVTVNPPIANLQLGGTQTYTADIRDQSGNVMTGQTVTWGSSSTATATVDATGLVRAVAVGSATISATAAGKVGTAIVSVINIPVATVAISGSTGTITAGTSANLSALLKDKDGNVLSNRAVTWSSNNSRVATVDAAGALNALSAGTASIIATSETITATLSLTVTAPAGSVAPSVASVSPSTLVPGAAATITGTNFGTTAALNTVYINGVKATVTAATATQLTATVPVGLPCQSTQQVNIDVLTLAGSATGKQTLQVATSRPLAVGATFLATAAQGNVACNELPTSGTYLISVFNAATSFDQSAGVELKGATGGTALGSLSSPIAGTRIMVPASRASSVSAVSSATSSAEAEHLARLGRAIQMMREFRKSRGGVSRSLSGTDLGGATRLPVPTTVGAVATINYNYNDCRASTSTPKITARVVYVGPKTIVLEDNAGALAGKIDADLISMAQDFENVSFPILTTNFGNPLAWDDSTDHNGRIIMMFTPQVNKSASNLLGFVQPCDLLRPSDGSSFSGSNTAELFYARAVTDTTAGSNSLDGRTLWKRQMPATLIHETKHIISFAERFATPVLITDYEETWIEEATAQLAGELYGRAIHGNKWKGNAGYAGTLDCEVRPTVAGCGGGIFVMGNEFGFLTDFLQNFESKSIVSDFGDGSNDNDIYGSSWLFTRWLTDTYGASEPSFIKSMVLNYNIIGVANATSLTGKTWAELLSQFTLMLAADDIPTAPAAYQEASWNLPAVFAGYNTDFPNSHPLTPFVPRPAAFGTNFIMPAPNLRGGGAMVVKLTGGGAGPQLLDLHDPAGTPLPVSSNIGISVLRIQ